MSLGAIDFGLIVDGAVVMIENMVRHLASAKAERELAALARELRARHPEAGREVASADLLRRRHHHHRLPADPHAAGRRGEDVPADGADRHLRARRLAGALVHARCRCWRASSCAGASREQETVLLRWRAREIYQPLLDAGDGASRGDRLAPPPGIFAAALGVAPMLGAEFIPRLDEGAIALQAWRLPERRRSRSRCATRPMIERSSGSFPEVTTVVSRTGARRDRHRPDGHRDQRHLRHPQAARRVDDRAIREEDAHRADRRRRLRRDVPGTRFSFSQPIEMRVQRADLRRSLRRRHQDLRRRSRRAEASVGDEVARVVSRGPRRARRRRSSRSPGLPVLRVIDRSPARSRATASTPRDVLDGVEAIGGQAHGRQGARGPAPLRPRSARFRPEAPQRSRASRRLPRRRPRRVADPARPARRDP